MSTGKLPSHLGGGEMRCHDDKGSLLWVKEKFNIKNMLDIGCGQGCQPRLAQSLGIDATGIDGDFSIKRKLDKFILHDYTTGPYDFKDQKFDLIWSVEFVEHVEEEYLPNFMKNFQLGKYVIMTFAPPGKAGHHHVNCRPAEYWIEKFNEYGFKYDEKSTAELKKACTMGKDFIRNNGMFFVRNDA